MRRRAQNSRRRLIITFTRRYVIPAPIILRSHARVARGLLHVGALPCAGLGGPHGKDHLFRKGIDTHEHDRDAGGGQ